MNAKTTIYRKWIFQNWHCNRLWSQAPSWLQFILNTLGLKCHIRLFSYPVCVFVYYEDRGTPPLIRLGRFGIFCKKKSPPKAILLHFLCPLYDYLYDCMTLRVRLKSQVVVVNTKQKISVILLHLISSHSENCSEKICYQIKISLT